MWYLQIGLVLAGLTMVIGAPLVWFMLTREPNVDHGQIFEGWFMLVFASLLTVLGWPFALCVHAISLLQWLVERRRKQLGLPIEEGKPYASSGGGPC